MTSKAFSQDAFLAPDRRQEIPSPLLEDRHARKATVYDAVAGRLSTAGFIPGDVVVASTRDTHSSSNVPVAPEAFLFKAKNAPTRYAESDLYFANEQNLRSPLPESDLLKALHCYASDFYSRTVAEDDSTDWHSMDETALLAFGILLEESGREILGETGDLVFTEGEDVDEPSKNSAQQAYQLQSMITSNLSSTPRTHKPTGSMKRRRVEDGANI